MDKRKIYLVPDEYLTEPMRRDLTINDTNLNALILTGIYLYAFVLAIFIF